MTMDFWLTLIGYQVVWFLVPAWLMALWLAFGLAIVPLFGFLMPRPLVAAGLGAAGGPLSWLSAARGWQAATLAEPIWQSLLALSAGWAIALPLLISLARHLQRFKTRS